MRWPQFLLNWFPQHTEDFQEFLQEAEGKTVTVVPRVTDCGSSFLTDYLTVVTAEAECTVQQQGERPLHFVRRFGTSRQEKAPPYTQSKSDAIALAQQLEGELQEKEYEVIVQDVERHTLSAHPWPYPVS